MIIIIIIIIQISSIIFHFTQINNIYIFFKFIRLKLLSYVIMNKLRLIYIFMLFFEEFDSLHFILLRHILSTQCIL